MYFVVTRSSGRLRSALFLAVSLIAILTVRTAGSDAVDFGAHIRPLLAEHCLQCHGPDEETREADLRLDTRAGATADRGGYAAVVPGDPKASELIYRITTSDPNLRMPPDSAGRPLREGEIGLLRQWIGAGARYDRHWAFQPIARPDVPDGEPFPTGSTDIDRFVVAALRQHNLSISPVADRRTLIRRVTFDLTGLPPSWKDVQDFVHDPAPNAYAKVVDRLLQSPHYGERWARHWLDIARYADTHGGGAIGFKRFPFSYTYRDYVIGALNNDVPYDQFLLQQLAADQLANSPAGSATDSATSQTSSPPELAALGFLTVGRQYRNRHDRIDDQIDVVTRGLMGLTVACARCHDHKYDPIPTRDYYSLYSVFASSSVPENLPILERPTNSKAYQRYRTQLGQRQQRLEKTIAEQAEVLRNRLRMQAGLYLKAIAEKVPEQDLSTVFLSYRTDDLRPLVLERWRTYLSERDDEDAVFGLWHRLDQLDASQFQASWADVVAELEKQNGDLSKRQWNQLPTEPPRWNPRVLQAIKLRRPQSMVDVADAYGKLFAEVTEQWLTSLLQAALEASPEGEIVPDQDKRHTAINSSVNRQLRWHLFGPEAPANVDDPTAAKLLNRPIKDHVGGLRGAIHELHLSSPGSPPRAMTLVETTNPRKQFVFRRGDPLDRGKPVVPRLLRVLGGTQESAFPDGQRRLGLARAIVDPENPLTRRVVVNWAWQRHFGLGLVRTPDDFGTRGELPTHPKLLDYLASCLLDDGWSLKKLHRRIVMSRVYRQQSVEDLRARRIDPENRLFWRMPRRRLEAEAMRDAMLAVAGRLDTSMGGRPFDLFAQPFIPRRSVYGFINRDVVADFFSTFDMADPSVCVAKRPKTIVPQQTLFALNSDFIQEQAQHLAAHPEVVAAEAGAERVRVLVRRVYGRDPSDKEIEMAIQYLDAQSSRPAQRAGTSPLRTRNAPSIAWQRLAHVLLAANEFVFLD